MTKSFSVPSSSDPLKTYTVVLGNDGTLSCPCTGWIKWKKSPNRPVRSCQHTVKVAKDLGIHIENHTVAAQLAVQPKLFEGEVKDGFISPMLASALKEGKSIDDYDNGDYVLETKYDGHRLIIRVAENEVIAWSRNGKIRQLSAHIVKQLNRLAIGTYDGELVIPGGVSTDVTALDKLSTSTLVLFDMLEVMGVSIMGSPYHRRREFLKEAIKLVEGTAITESFMIHGANPEKLSFKACLKNIWDEGGEGAIVKRLNAYYFAGKRSPDWIKFKEENTVEVTVVAFEEGLMGPHSKVVVEDDHGIEFTVKSLNDAWRAFFAAGGDKKVIGERMVISYQMKTRDGRYRHPMADHFVRINI